MKVAVIGVGRMGRRHVQVVRSLGLELAGVSDVNDAALSAAEAEGVPKALLFKDAATLLQRVAPECVVVATTAPTHCEYTCAAAEAGAKFILCEKPLAISLDQCDRMIEACRRHGAKLAVNHQMRVMEQYIESKRIFELPEFGGLGSMTVTSGNFGLAMNGIHYFEAFRFLTGEAPCSVTAWFSNEVVPNPRGKQFEDRAGSVRLLTPSGKRFYLECGTDQGHGMHATYCGRRGQLHVDELYGEMRMAVRETEHRNLPTTRYGMPAIRSTRTIAPVDAVTPSAAVLKALLAGGDYPTGADGRLAVSLLVAAYVSHERGNTVVDLSKETLPLSREFPWA
jgi:predicted dehydrogenase